MGESTMILRKLSGETIINPSKEDILSDLTDVIAYPNGDNGATSLELKRDDGWRLTAYGYDLVILDHKNGYQNIPVHISSLNKENVEKLLVRFLSAKDDLSDIDWNIGYT